MYHTIPGFEEMTAQQIFDMSASHLLKQNKRSVQGDGSTCMYRKDDLKCAAGVFLTDEGAFFADRLWQRSEPRGSAWDDVVRAELAPKRHAPLIRDLQNIHDYYDPPVWPEKLIALAKDYNLSDDVVTKRINE